MLVNMPFNDAVSVAEVI